ncbi:unnamed protein product, partial [Effrenium voratum]
QATCGKLWIQVLRSGSPQLQDQIFVQLKLLQGLCHAILEDQRSPKARHPGGVGTIVQVLQVLAECTQERAPLAERPPKGRPPLGEKMLQEAPEVLDKEKAAEENFLKKLVSSSSLWPQVLAALPPPPARVTVTRAYNSSSNFDI